MRGHEWIALISPYNRHFVSWLHATVDSRWLSVCQVRLIQPKYVMDLYAALRKHFPQQTICPECTSGKACSAWKERTCDVGHVAPITGEEAPPRRRHPQPRPQPRTEDFVADLISQLLDRHFRNPPPPPPPPAHYSRPGTYANAAKVLGVAIDAPAAVIIAAARKLAMKNHPDLGGDEEKMKEINVAKDVMLGKRST